MKEKLKVPKIRFKDFSGEWNYDKLDNILEAKLRPITKPLISYEALGVRCHAKGTFHKEVEDPNSVAIETLYEVKENDLIVNITFAWEHAIAICKKEDEGRLVSHRFPTYVPKDNLSVNFLNYLIKQEFFRYNLELISPGGAGRNRVMNKSKFLEIKLFLPSLAEQQKIANFLSVVDEKIEKLTKKKELLEQYKKGVMQKIFSQEIRFKDDNGNDFPEWEEKELGEVNIEISDGNYGELYPKSDELKKEGIPFIRANNIKNLKLIWKDMKYIDEDLHKILTSGHLETGDILVTTRGDIGMIAYVSQEFDGANINAQICLLRIKNHSINNIYLLQYLSSKKVLSQFKALQTGSALKQLPKKNLEKLLLVLPSLPEQQKIADFLSALDKKIDIVYKELGQVQEFKKGLLQQMFV